MNNYTGRANFQSLSFQNLNFPVYPSPPSLFIKTQNSLCEEQVNGQDSSVHVVVKNSPFVISLALQYDPTFPNSLASISKYLTNNQPDLGKMTFDCRLIYDAEGEEKEVDYVTNRPYLFKVNAVNGGTQADVELRLKVLSSQHEDLFFRVKFVALDPLTKCELGPSLTALSAPIKVISKPEQLKKRRPTKKRTMNLLLIETLNRIEQAQKLQQQLLDQLQLSEEVDHMQAEAGFSNSVRLSLVSPQQNGNNSRTTISLGNNTSGARKLGFEEAVEKVLREYGAIVESERPKKIRKVLQSVEGQQETLSELNDMFVSEGLNQNIGTEVSVDSVPRHNSRCSCSSCPYKVELDRIELFYKDVFHL